MSFTPHLMPPVEDRPAKVEMVDADLGARCSLCPKPAVYRRGSVYHCLHHENLYFLIGHLASGGKFSHPITETKEIPHATPRAGDPGNNSALED